jgi:hypothetical protein
MTRMPTSGDQTMKIRLGVAALALTMLALPVAWSQDSKPAQEMINKEAHEAIDAGLAYLAKEQAADGSWGTTRFKGNVGVSSLAGLAFLSAGHRPGQGPHGEVVAKAVDFMLQCGTEKHFRSPLGFFYHGQNFNGPMYGHAYGVLFLAEAHAVVPDKKKQEVKDALTRGVKIILDAQSKEGGWRYYAEPRDADLSVTCGQIHALLAAMKAGVDVPEETLDKAIRYVRSCHDSKEGNFRYQPGWGKSNTPFALCAVAVSALATAKAGEDEPFTKGLAYLRSQRGRPDNSFADASLPQYLYYGNYYAAQAMKQVGGKDWQEWYPAIRKGLLKPKTSRGNDGNWPGGFMCPHFNTALAVLILQMPESHLMSAKR